MTNEKNGSDVSAAIEAVERLAVSETVDLTAPESKDALAVLPAGKTLVDLKPYHDARRTAPERRKGMASFTLLESFIAHTKRFADEHSAVFVDDSPKQPTLTAVLDYHEQGAEGSPRFGVHRGHYRFPLSEEWIAWTGLPDKIDQGSLAVFIEDHISDVLDPAAAGDQAAAFADKLSITLASASRLMDLSRGLSVRVDTKVSGHVNLGSGEAKIAFEESHADQHGGPITVPGGFVIAIPVFRGGDLFTIPVRLTYRVSRANGSISWRIQLHRADRVQRFALDEAVAKVAAETGLPVYHGAPEAG